MKLNVHAKDTCRGRIEGNWRGKRLEEGWEGAVIVEVLQ
jgi:hypothetical protein